MDKKKIFISYAWECEEKNLWVRKLADALEELSDIHVTWDGYDLGVMDDKNHFMESAVFESHFCIVIGTKAYAEKANSRGGGVGIETYLGTSRHWESLQENNKTFFVTLLREDGGTPNYLKGHFYIDFKDDESFSQSFAQLKRVIRGEDKVSRPKKVPRKEESFVVNDLTRVSEILGLVAKNKKPIVTLKEGTDFSSNNRIKFEVWETRTPAVNHIIALHDNINIQQTLSRAARILVEKEVNVKDLIILRPREGRDVRESFLEIYKKDGGSGGVNLVVCTYNKYIWDYCIDDDFKEKDVPQAIDFYTQQEIDCSGVVLDSAVEALYEGVLLESSFGAHLVIGEGGIGKTSLCLSLVNKINSAPDFNGMAILIRAEDIRKCMEEGSNAPTAINGIYEVYEFQMKYLGQNNIFDKKTFELSILAGNVVLVVDGLDELATTFMGGFDVKSFMSSVIDLHKELSSSKVVLTSREDVFDGSEGLDDSVRKYTLLGFNDKSCQNYLKSRFRGYEEKDKIIDRTIHQIESNIFKDEQRIVPFFVDVVSSIIEESLDTGKEAFDISISDSMTPYPSLNELTDKIVLAIFEREEARDKFSMSVADMVSVFCELNIEIDGVWQLKRVEEILSIFYDMNSSSILKSIKQNPLIVNKGDALGYKYDFLNSYFNSLSLFKYIEEKSSDEEFLNLVARMDFESNEFNDLRRYISQSEVDEVEMLSPIAKHFRKYVEKDTEGEKKIEKVKSFLEVLNYLIFSLGASKREEFTSSIKRLYGQEGSSDFIGLCLKGELPPFDFTGINISRGRFKSYRNFLASSFTDAYFMYCEFSDCHNSSMKTTQLASDNIDSNTCVIGNLSESFDMKSEHVKSEEAAFSKEMKKFLGSFYKGGRFRDNNKVHIRFSSKVSGLSRQGFDKLISSGYFYVRADKSVDTFYAISDGFTSSVRKYLNDGRRDSEMKRFFRIVQRL